MSPRYLEDQLGRSLRNLGLAAVDVYYVHNPETQLGSVPRKAFLARIRAAFEMLERQVASGRVGRYGVATWNGFRTRPDAREHLSLAEMVREAETVAGHGHHFKVIQLPYNLARHEAYAAATQVVEGERLTPLEAAARFGVAVMASASILQGQLSHRLPQAMADAFPGLDTWAQRALQFVRSTPGITAALIGMGRRELDAILRQLQNELFDLGGELATPAAEFRPGMFRVGAAEVKALETLLDRCQKALRPLRSFVLPGGGRVSAFLHVARTVCRRAERDVLRLMRREDIGEWPLAYLNRLSDLLFVLSRWIGHHLGEREFLWKRPLQREAALRPRRKR